MFNMGDFGTMGITDYISPSWNSPITVPGINSNVVSGNVSTGGFMGGQTTTTTGTSQTLPQTIVTSIASVLSSIFGKTSTTTVVNPNGSSVSQVGAGSVQIGSGGVGQSSTVTLNKIPLWIVVIVVGGLILIFRKSLKRLFR
jgi:hypothetical protein